MEEKKGHSTYSDVRGTLFCEEFLPNCARNGDQVLYGYGVLSKEALLSIETWLEKEGERDFVLILDQIGDIEQLLMMEGSDRLFQREQSHLFFRLSLDDEQFCDRLAQEFPFSNIWFFNFSGDRLKGVQDYENQLRRSTHVASSTFNEITHYPKLFPSLVKNFAKLPTAFFPNHWKGAFKGVPAVICGAGPSLEANRELLDEVKDRALLIAGGSALSALSNLAGGGVAPHLGICIDPNNEEFDRLRGCQFADTPLIIASRVNPHIHELFSSPIGYLPICAGGLVEQEVELALGINQSSIFSFLDVEAMSVTSVSLSLAIYLGCNPISFAGVDLSFSGKNGYAGGVDLSGSERLSVGDYRVAQEGIGGKQTISNVNFAAEKRALERIVLAHANRQFYNLSDRGVELYGVVSGKNEQFAKTCERQYDFEGWIHTLIQDQSDTKRTKQMQQALESCLSEMKGELSQLMGLMKEYMDLLKMHRKETPKMTAILMDMKGEKAFDLFAADLFVPIEQLVCRRMRLLEEEVDPVNIEWQVWQQVYGCLEKYSESVNIGNKSSSMRKSELSAD
ncbi:MAG: hypothetical protein S4CHLAM102_04270 [Chlamydiia bacterium]|nr:hypothetical protein [Chlamydiia bacterium]